MTDGMRMLLASHASARFVAAVVRSLAQGYVAFTRQIGLESESKQQCGDEAERGEQGEQVGVVVLPEGWSRVALG